MLEKGFRRWRLNKMVMGQFKKRYIKITSKMQEGQSIWAALGTHSHIQRTKRKIGWLFINYFDKKTSRQDELAILKRRISPAGRRGREIKVIGF